MNIIEELSEEKGICIEDAYDIILKESGYYEDYYTTDDYYPINELHENKKTDWYNSEKDEIVEFFKKYLNFNEFKKIDDDYTNLSSISEAFLKNNIVYIRDNNNNEIIAAARIYRRKDGFTTICQIALKINVLDELFKKIGNKLMIRVVDGGKVKQAIKKRGFRFLRKAKTKRGSFWTKEY